MNLPLAIRGTSGRQGLYLTGKPQQFILFEDGIVITSASNGAVLLGGGIVGGSLTELSTKRRLSKAQASSSGADYAASTKRAQFIPYADFEKMELKKAYPERRLVYTLKNGKQQSHSFGQIYAGVKDEVLIPVLETALGERFSNSLSQ